jgi:hypothetical protein
MKILRRDITPDMIRAEFSYDPETGIVCKKTTGHSGWKRGNGYVQVNAFGHVMLAHRVAFVVHHGRWPANGIDHINGNPSDNRMVNLREATGSENMRNQRVRSDSKTGVPGVCWLRKKNRYAAVVWVGRKQIHIGYYKTIKEATDARIAAELKYHGEFSARLSRMDRSSNSIEAGRDKESGEARGIQ